jgi:hypothetical protein
MDTVKFLNVDCVGLENSSLSLLITQSVGPRIISLRFNGGDNLFAELPDTVSEHPDGSIFHFYGGHRLWHAPENMPRTYQPDNEPVDVIPTQNGLTVLQPVEKVTGIEKSIDISLVGEKPQVIVRHTLANRGVWPVACAPWAITQLKPGGIAILPQSREDTRLLPNRAMALWPYSDIASPYVNWGNKHILIHAKMDTAFKVGYPNLRGWLAYWHSGTLFVKRAAFNPNADYYDFGSSSTCYCGEKFIELETLGPKSTIEPGESVTHTESWELYSDVQFPENEEAVDGIVADLGLE